MSKLVPKTATHKGSTVQNNKKRTQSEGRTKTNSRGCCCRRLLLIGHKNLMMEMWEVFGIYGVWSEKAVFVRVEPVRWEEGCSVHQQWRQHVTRHYVVRVLRNEGRCRDRWRSEGETGGSRLIAEIKTMVEIPKLVLDEYMYTVCTCTYITRC